MKPLTVDRAPAVREASFRAVSHWLGYVPPGSSVASAAGGGEGSAAAASAARARCRTHAPELLPLLLLGLSDPQASTAELALDLLEGVGGVWGAGGPAAASAAAPDSMDVDAAATTTTSTPGGVAQPPPPPADVTMAEASDATPSAPPAAPSAAATAAAQLPPPYRGLPSAAARAMAAPLLPQLLPPILQELGEWTVSMRAHAARWVGPPSASCHIARDIGSCVRPVRAHPALGPRCSCTAAS
jgi:hypothetical protein